MGGTGRVSQDQVFDQSFIDNVNNVSNSIKNNASKIYSDAKNRSNPLIGFSNPEIEFSAYEYPSAEVCDDYKNVLEEHGIDFQSIHDIA